jgi:hypothetical protein
VLRASARVCRDAQALLCAEAPGGVGWQVRPPAIVTEYMSGGSLRSALSRRLEGVQGALTRLLIALDAAKARHQF